MCLFLSRVTRNAPSCSLLIPEKGHWGVLLSVCLFLGRVTLTILFMFLSRLTRLYVSVAEESHLGRASSSVLLSMVAGAAPLHVSCS